MNDLSVLDYLSGVNKVNFAGWILCFAMFILSPNGLPCKGNFLWKVPIDRVSGLLQFAGTE